MLISLGLFILASILTLLFSKRLTYYADGISLTTGLGKGLVGLILLSTVTSLPELASSLSASFMGSIDLAFGNVFGSNMTNIFILVIMDLFLVGKPILSYAERKNITIGSVVMFLTTVTLLLMLLARLEVLKEIDVWFFSLIIFLVYMISMFLLYKYESGMFAEEPTSTPTMSKAKALYGFSLYGFLVFLAALLLSYSADMLSQISIGEKDLGGTFVGTLFMAFTTSLPEIVISITAIKMNNYDMALGNLFGSNLFNLAILSFSDAAYRIGSLSRGEGFIDDAFSVVSVNHSISGLIGLLFITIVVASLAMNKKNKKSILGIDTFMIALFYFLGLYLLFLLR